MTDRKNGNSDPEKGKTFISSPLDDIAPAPEEAEAADVVFGETRDSAADRETVPEKPEDAPPTPPKKTTKTAKDKKAAPQPEKKVAPKAQPAPKAETTQPKSDAEEYHSPAEIAVDGAAKKKNKNKPVIIACCSCLGIIAAVIVIIFIAGVITEMTGASESGYLNGPGDSVQFLVEAEEPTLTITFEYPAGEADFWVYVTDAYGNPVMDWWDLDTGTVLSLAGNQNYYVTIYSMSGAGEWSASW